MKIQIKQKIKLNNIKTYKPRVLVVISCFYPIIGGAEKQAQLFAETLNGVGYEVKVLTRQRFATLPKNEVLNNTCVLRRGNSIFTVAYEVFKQRNNFDVLFLIGEFKNINAQILLGLFTKTILNKKVVFRLSTDVEEYKKDILTSNIFKKLIKYFDLFLPVSNEIKNYLLTDLKIQPNKVLNPPFNFIDTDKFNIPTLVETIKTKEELKILTNKKIVTFIGRAVERKGITEFLDAATQLDCFIVLVLAAHKPTEFVENLKNKISLLGSNKIFVVWNDPNPNKYLKISDIVVIPSHFEPKGSTMLEALLCGVPCAVSNIQTATESLPPELFKYVFEPKNTQDLKTKLKDLLLTTFTPSQKKLLRQHIYKTYSKEYLIYKYKRVFKELGYL